MNSSLRIATVGNYRLVSGRILGTECERLEVP